MCNTCSPPVQQITSLLMDFESPVAVVIVVYLRRNAFNAGHDITYSMESVIQTVLELALPILQQ